MFTVGSIIKFTPFYFKNGNTAKTKYMLIVANNNDKVIVNVLTTSQDNVPNDWKSDSNCNYDDSRGLHYYLFKKNEIITECEFCFNLDTYILAEHIEINKISYYDGIYNYEKDVVVLGTLKQDILNNFIECLIKNQTITRKFRKALTLSES